MYKPINGWTKGRIISHIKENFKGKAKNDDGYCMYRDDNGNKCAVGLFIPDDVYTEKMERNSLAVLTEPTCILKSVLENILPLEVEAMNKLQTIHDHPSSTSKSIPNDMIKWIEENVKGN